MIIKECDYASFERIEPIKTLYNASFVSQGDQALKSHSMQLYTDNKNNQFLINETVRGTIKSPKDLLYEVDDSAYLVKDLKTMKIVDYEFESKMNINQEPHSVFLGDIKKMPPPYRQQPKMFLYKPFERHNVFNTSESIDAYIDYYEELSEIDYVRFIGILNLFFSLWNNILPIRAHVIIDGRSGLYNFRNIQYVSIIQKETLYPLLRNFNQRLSLLTRLIYQTCRRYQRALKVLVGLDYFGSILKICDYDKRENTKITLSMNDFINEVLLGIIHKNMYFTYPQETEFLLSDTSHNTFITDAYRLYGDISYM